MTSPNVFLRLSITISTLILVFFTSSSHARDYYVSTIGYNNNSGYIDSPFRTISKAASLARAGDNVIIRGGTYWERVIVRNSGSSGRHITFKPYSNETVTIDGSGTYVPYWGGLFDFSNRNYIRVDKLNVVNSNSKGLFGQFTDNIIVSNCYTKNTVSSGIGVHFGSNLKITGNEVVYANTTGDQENISVESMVNFEISNNHVHHGGTSSQGGEGIDAKGDSHHGKIFGNRVHHINREGIYVDSFDGYLTDVEIYNNVVYSNHISGIQVGNEAGGYIEDISIYNNVVYDNQWAGINLWGGGHSGKSHGMGKIYITGNTVAKNGWTPWGLGIASDNKEAHNVLIINNILSKNTGMQIRLDPAVSKGNYNIQYNLVDNSNRAFKLQGSGDTLGDNVVNASPEFVDIYNNDFRLKGNSPAIGKGHYAPSLPNFDIKNKQRTGYSGIAMGAYQP
ncbi:MAG: right-handed parallel beta-helix repeat-containing protein [Methylococcaceae bacterium]